MLNGQLKIIPFIISIAIGFVIWFSPAPNGLDIQAWHMLAIFLATIVALISAPLPMGACAIISLTIACLTETLSFQQSFASFSHPVIWLVLCAFFIAKGFSVTGLGQRIAYIFVAIFGKKTIGLAYGMLLSDLILAPGMPSATARCGGFLYPIICSISRSYGSHPTDQKSAKKIGSYLILNTFQGTVLTSAMFLTAMAGNPFVVSLAERMGVEITWGDWFLGAIVPGSVCLMLLPLLLFVLNRPSITETPKAREWASEKLKEMGPISVSELVMLGTFILLLVLWIFGKSLGISSTLGALIGLSILLLSGVLKWGDLIKLSGAWETMIWFSALITMADQLSTLGFTNYFTENMCGFIHNFSWPSGLIFLVLVYFYSHYFFASATAHAGAMYSAILALAFSLGAPHFAAALIFGYATNLFGGLTHYSLAPAPLLFGAGYVPITTWWGIGFVCSLLYITIFGTIGVAWWIFLGFL